MSGSDTVWLVFTLESPTPAGAFTTFPDIEAVCAGWLRDQALTGVGARVYTEVPPDPTFPLVTVRRVGGVPAIRQYLDTASIQVDVWGSSKAEAQDVARDARLELHRLEGAHVLEPLAFVHAVDDSLGLTWLPDDLSGRARYTFGVLVYYR